jgi:hypothetical protein
MSHIAIMKLRKLYPNGSRLPRNVSKCRKRFCLSLSAEDAIDNRIEVLEKVLRFQKFANGYTI